MDEPIDVSALFPMRDVPEGAYSIKAINAVVGNAICDIHNPNDCLAPIRDTHNSRSTADPTTPCSSGLRPYNTPNAEYP